MEPAAWVNGANNMVATIATVMANVAGKTLLPETLIRTPPFVFIGMLDAWVLQQCITMLATGSATY
jgi:hypothetical protein